MTRRLSTLALILVSLFGLGLILYPSLSNAWNERHATRAIAAYSEELSAVDEESYAEVWEAALAYNEKVSQNPGFELTPELAEEYASVLDISGLGILGYVEIPAIKVSLPIYHGTSDGVLQVAAGHLDWTNLPIGGEGTHCAISGHRGLSSARLFTDLPRLKAGDVFYIRVLNELLTYEVDQEKTVLPYELNDLLAESGKDYFTLITCTPYAVNTHRLLVRGHRIANEEEVRRVLVPADALRVEPLIVAPILAAPIVLMMIILVFLMPEAPSQPTKKGKRHE